MSDNLKNSKVGLTHQLEEIEKLIEDNDYITALAQIREVQSTGKLGSFSLPEEPFTEEMGLFYYSAAKVLRHFGSYEEALETGQRAISIFIELHNELKIAQVQFLLGLISIAMGNLKSAETEIRDALTGYKRLNDLEGVISCLSRLSNIEAIRGSYSKSIEYLQDALLYANQLGDSKKKAFLYGNLGDRFLMVGKWKEAERKLLLNTGLNRQAGNEINLCKGLLSLGYVYFLKREFKKAKDTYEESLSLIQKNNCVRELTIYHEFSGELAFVKGDYQSAENHYKKVFEIMSERAPEGDMISQTYRLLADLQVAKKEYDQAFNSCKKALKVSKSLGEIVEESACYRILGQIYTVRNDKEKAQENFSRSLNIFQEINTKYELAKTYLEAGKSDCYDYYERMKYLSMAEDKFKELESEYHLGLVKLAHSYLFFDKQEYISAGLYLKDAEKIYKELGEEKELALVAEFRNKLSRFSGEVEVSSFEKIYTFSNIITRNKKMLEIIEQSRQIKDTDMTILIEGETGTGKDLLANCIHYESKRKNKKLITISCAAIPEHLLESELFGHKKGSFTSSSYDKKGLIEEADGSTLFLNEVGDLTLNIQAKLLGVMDNKELTRLGETRPRKVDFRIIAASNKNLEEAVKSGRFRDDLYFRLKVIEIVLPPLRERKEDILLLIEHYLKETGIAEDNLKLSEYPELIERIQGYDWPGNIRELENEVKSLILFPERKFLETLNNPNQELNNQSLTLNSKVEELKKNEIIEALKKYNGNRKLASEFLGISEATLCRKIKLYNIPL
jgi:DNA-binding NtrC family response regulator/predicted negative regulator of RcsB-dependent stress response